MLETRSAVLKMLYESANMDRKIDSFPHPFHEDYTPYKQFDFSEFVKTACGKIKPNISALRLCKVIVLGDVAVGKTSLVNRFCHHTFDSNYKATIGVDFEVERFDVLSIPFNVQIWDTAGQERFKCIAQSYYRSAHIIVLVFDLCNLMTLSHCVTWLDEALRSSIHEPYIFLVGTKKDVLGDTVYKGIEKYAVKVSKELNAEYWAVSARSGEGVDDLFKRIAALAFNQTLEREKDASPPIRIGSTLSCLQNNSKDIATNRVSCMGCN